MSNKTCVLQILSAETDHVFDAKNPQAPSYDFHTQTAYVTGSGPFPSEMKVTLPKGAPPYAPGIYLLGGGCLVAKAVTAASGKARISFSFEPSAQLVPLADAVKELGEIFKQSAAASGPRAVNG